jgi:hypothetical protein
MLLTSTPTIRVVGQYGEWHPKRARRRLPRPRPLIAEALPTGADPGPPREATCS